MIAKVPLLDTFYFLHVKWVFCSFTFMSKRNLAKRNLFHIGQGSNTQPHNYKSMHNKPTNSCFVISDESLFSSIPLAFVYPFDSYSVLNCSSLVCFHLLGFIGPLFQIWVNFTLFGLIFVFNYF